MSITKLQRYEIRFALVHEESTEAVKDRLDRLNNELGPLFAHIGRGPSRRNRSFGLNGGYWTVIGTLPQKKEIVSKSIQSHGFTVDGHPVA